MHISDKVVLITGASMGIGAACAQAFRRRGARLSLVARSLEGGEAALSIPADLLNAGDREAAVQRTLDHYGRIDILINNAGVGLYEGACVAPLASVRQMFELNFFAALHMSQLVIPSMRAQRCGTIVNVGSIAGKMTLPWFTLYSASKYALGSLTDGLRMELKRDQVHAMLVCPGYVQTAFQKNVIAGSPPASMQRGRRFAISAEQCAEAIARGVERDARTVVTPPAGWLMIALARLFPTMVDAQLERMNQRS